jgi:hypothetical protein
MESCTRRLCRRRRGKKNAPRIAPRGVPPGVAARRERVVAQGVSTRTMVGAGRPVGAAVDDAAEVRVAGARPLKLRPIVPVAPVVALAGALTVMLPAAASPSVQLNKV